MIYLIHLDKPLSDQHTAQHYLGFCEKNLARRIREHSRGRGARFMEVAKERAISFKIARVWAGSRSDERRLKERKEAPRFCPFCSEKPRRVSYLEDMDIADALWQPYIYREDIRA